MVLVLRCLNNSKGTVIGPRRYQCKKCKVTQTLGSIQWIKYCRETFTFFFSPGMMHAMQAKAFLRSWRLMNWQEKYWYIIECAFYLLLDVVRSRAATWPGPIRSDRLPIRIRIELELEKYQLETKRINMLIDDFLTSPDCRSSKIPIC